MSRAKGEVTAIMQRLMASPDGMTGKQLQIELGDVTIGTAAGRISRLVGAGLAFGVNQGADRVRHFFPTQEAADAWKATQPGRGHNFEFGGKRYVPKAKANITYSKPEEPKGEGRLRGEPVITSATRVTVAPTPLPLFHVPADFRGPFSQAGIGRDMQTGKAWEQRA